MQIWESEISIAELTASIEDFFQGLLLPMFHVLSESADSLFFIIDGLNECPTNFLPDILKLLSLLQHLPPNPGTPYVRVLLTCQPTDQILKGLQSSNRVNLHVNNQDCIKNYIEHKLNADLTKRFRDCGFDPLSHLGDPGRHKGMFLWVATLLNDLERVDSDEDFRTYLEEGSETINALYRQGLNHLEQTLSNTETIWINEILTWTVMAKISLQLPEIETGIVLSRKIRFGLDDEVALFSAEQTLSKCGAFLHIVSLDPSGNKRVVSLLHDTFKQFVTNAKEYQGKFLVHPDDTNALIALATLSYLSKHTIEPVSTTDIPISNYDCEHPLFSYATLYWSTHLREAQKFKIMTLKDDLTRAVRRFLEKRNLLSWFRSVLTYSDQSPDCSTNAHVQSVALTVENIAIWMNLQKLQITTDPVLGSTRAKRNRAFLFKWCSQVAATAWLIGDPVNIEASMAAFLICRRLYENFRATQPAHEVRDTIAVLSRLADVDHIEKQSSWHVNIGHAYRHEFPELTALRSATKHYLNALRSSREANEIAFVKYLVSATLAMIYTHTELKDDIDQSIVFGEEAVTTGLDQVSSAMYADNLSVALRIRYESSRSIKDLDRAIKIGRLAVSLVTEDHTKFASYTSNLSSALRKRFEWNGAINDINEAIEFGWQSISKVPDQPVVPKHANNLSAALWRRYDRLKLMDDLNESVHYAELALALTPDKHPDRHIYTGGLALVLWIRYESLRIDSDLNSAITHAESAVAETLQGHPARVINWYILASVLREKWKFTKSMDDLEDALVHAKWVVESTQDIHPSSALYKSTYASLLDRLHDQTSCLDPLSKAISLYQSAVKLAPSWAIADNATNLGCVFYKRYQLTGAINDLNQAIESFRKSVSNAPEELKPFYSENLEIAMAEKLNPTTFSDEFGIRYPITWVVGDLTTEEGTVRDRRKQLDRRFIEIQDSEILTDVDVDVSIDDLDQAIDKCKALDVLRFSLESQSANTRKLYYLLGKRFEKYGRLVDLNEIIACAEKAALADDSDLFPALLTLTQALVRRYRYTFAIDDLEGAIEKYTMLLQLSEECLDGEKMATIYGNMAGLLFTRFKHIGSLNDVDGAIDHLEQAHSFAPLECSRRPRWAANLSTVFLTRYIATSIFTDLTRSIKMAELAIDSSPPDDPDRIEYIQILSESWRKMNEQQLGDMTLLRNGNDCR